MSEEKDLPPGWCWARLGDIGTLLNGDRGKNYPSKSAFVQAGIPFINAGHLDAGRIDLAEMNYITEDRFAALSSGKIRPDDILYCLRGSLGKAAIVSGIERGAIASSLAIIRIVDEGCIKYLYYFLVGPTGMEEIRRYDNGSAQPNLSAASVTQFRVPLAPLNEQKRIADKLDAVLARVDACRERLDRVPAILNRFRQAVLTAATSGQLTEEWRATMNRSVDSWQTRRGEDVFPFITSGSRGWATYYADAGAIFLRVGNLDHDTIELDLREIQHVNPPSSAEGKRTRIEVGDILISITADVGMVALVRKDVGEAYINQHLCLARQTGEYLGAYLAYYLASPLGGLAQLTEAQRGVTKAGLTLGDIRNLAIEIPELDEQHEIVRRVESLFTYADRLEARYTAARAQVERLTQALLAKAFRGELVPQDPNDEPAAMLLERIRALGVGRNKRSVSGI